MRQVLAPVFAIHTNTHDAWTAPHSHRRNAGFIERRRKAL
jgi:hypothetical protein